MRISREQYDAILKKQVKPSKYHSRKKTVGNRVFDSTKEANRYAELLMLQQAGEITDLKCQFPIAIIVGGMHVCNYVADFVYYCRVRKTMVHEDSKGFKTELYRLKKKLVKASCGIEITET